nr:hypothetical protein [Burkholderia ubonensis]
MPKCSGKTEDYHGEKVRDTFAYIALTPGNGKQRQVGSNMVVDITMTRCVSPEEELFRIGQIIRFQAFHSRQYCGVE